jgi:hypothetical protein
MLGRRKNRASAVFKTGIAIRDLATPFIEATPSYLNRKGKR